MHPSPVTGARKTVVIVGGGPVGFTLAALLSRRGIRSVVVEADDGYCTGSRAICIARRSLEILAWAGAASRLIEIGLPWVGGRSYFRDAEVLHFRMPSEPGERFPPMINVQQYHVEEAAHRAIVDGQCDVRWSTRVLDVTQDDEGVRVETVDADGTRATVMPDWVVACDGGRSAVRQRLGLSLQGIEYEGRYVIVDIEQDTRREVERLAWFDPPSNPGSTILMHRQPGNVWRIDYQLRDDEDPATAILPEQVLPRVQSHLAMIGEDAPWKPLWISIYNAKCLTLPDYRCGRVLFAGDAAHLVPIFGVRGLNSGIDDAGNLAWKLAAVIDGRAAPTLLDSYTVERLQATRENMAHGARSTEFMAPPHAGFRLMREAALRLALEHDGARSLLNPRQTTPSHYADTPLSVDDDPLTGRPAPDARVDARAGARVGARVDARIDARVDARVDDRTDARIEALHETHLSERFGRRFVLLCFDVHVDGDHAADVEVVHVLRAGSTIDTGPSAVVDRHGEAWRRYGAAPGDAVLVRPDGYVMARLRRPTVDVLRSALARASCVDEAVDAA